MTRPVLNKSTIVRSIQSGLRLVNAVSPEAAARAASWFFFRSPPRQPLTAPQQACLDAGRPARIYTASGPVCVWRFGAGPRVVLQHGWGGWGAQLHAFVKPLVDAGHEVVVIDAPGHGQSPGSESSFPAMADAIEAVSEGAPIALLVAHSLGCCGAILALERGVSVGAFVGVAGPAHPLKWFDTWMGAVLDEPAIEREKARLERRNGWALDAIDTAMLARNRTEPMLWIHDTADREVGFEAGEEVVESWPGARMHATTGLGHRRILEDPGVVATVLDFHRSVA
ncbi:MAG: alpha/beta fold hydrolase [Alphaproteobacteria bacterium]|nr:alpha/beta fold hydrolase [Alphaproteobacteria bacterium]